MAETLSLEGGFFNDVWLKDGYVSRPLLPRSDFVHTLLDCFGEAGWTGAPRFLGNDGDDREALSYIAGRAAWERSRLADIQSDESLTAVALLVREFHDLTALHPISADSEVVCHNDLSPKNTVYGNGDGWLRAIAFIDWDLAAPGRRIHDVAHVCWQYLDLGPAVTNVSTAARRMRLISDAYGLTAATRGELVDTVMWWQNRCWRGIEAAAATGDPAMHRLQAMGVPEEVRQAHQWVQNNQDQLRSQLHR